MCVLFVIVTVMDARKMEYVPDQCFDLVVDKGLFDTFLCNENNLRDVESYLKECYRVLKTGGVLLVISHGGPRYVYMAFRCI